MASSGPTPTGPCLSCAEGSRAGRRTRGAFSPEWSGGAESLPLTAGRGSLGAAQEAIGFLGCKCTLLAHVHPPVPQDLLGRAALNPIILQPVLILGIAPIHMQVPALGHVELHEVRTGPPLKVPLDGIPSLRHVDCTTQLGVVAKLAEGAFDPTVCVTDGC